MVSTRSLSRPRAAQQKPLHPSSTMATCCIVVDDEKSFGTKWELLRVQQQSEFKRLDAQSYVRCVVPGAVLAFFDRDCVCWALTLLTRCACIHIFLLESRPCRPKTSAGESSSRVTKTACTSSPRTVFVVGQCLCGIRPAWHWWHGCARVKVCGSRHGEWRLCSSTLLSGVMRSRAGVYAFSACPVRQQKAIDRCASYSERRNPTPPVHVVLC